MSEAVSKLEAVRWAREQRGEGSSQELADFIDQQFGIKLQPTIVTVLLGSLKEREHLEATRKKAQADLERAFAEQASEKKARRKKSVKPEAKENGPLPNKEVVG